jgi:hypothetical protein
MIRLLFMENLTKWLILIKIFLVMESLSQIKDLLDFLSSDNHWKLVLNNNNGFYSIKDIHDELLNKKNDYKKYFRIYINHRNTSILVHRPYCPDQKFGPSGIVDPIENGIWLGYFKLPKNTISVSEKELEQLQEEIKRNLSISEIENNIPNQFIKLLLLKLAKYLSSQQIWSSSSRKKNTKVILKICKRCWKPSKKKTKSSKKKTKSGQNLRRP